MTIDLNSQQLQRALHAFGDIDEGVLSALLFKLIAEKVIAIETNEQIAASYVKVAPF